MAKPWIHSLSSARKFGGTPDEYMPIHCLMDSSKAVLPDNRHRALTHHSWFIGTVLEQIFGATFVNSAGRAVSTRDVGEQHVFEDFGFIPTAQDYLAEIEYRGWMGGRGHGTPPSYAKIAATTTTKETRWDKDGD